MCLIIAGDRGVSGRDTLSKSENEEDNTIEVCAVVQSIAQPPVSFPFIVSLSINDNTAGTILSFLTQL